MPVAYYVSLDSIASRNAMINSGINFITQQKNIYLPFLGIVLQDIYKKKIINDEKMMPATQMVFLELLYNGHNKTIIKSEIAKRLHLTKTSITRATDQLLQMELITEKKVGTERQVFCNYKKQELFIKAKEHLINPVQEVIEIKKTAKHQDLYEAGETAMAHYTSLNAPKITNMAIYKNLFHNHKYEQADSRYDDLSNCMKLELWKYNPSYFSREGKVDPASLYCTLIDTDDERVEKCMEELIEVL